MISPTAVAEPVESASRTMVSAQQLAEEEGLSFAGTPGPGYSEGATSTNRRPPPKAFCKKRASGPMESPRARASLDGTRRSSASDQGASRTPDPSARGL